MEFSAEAPSLGYMYQIRYALYSLLISKEEVVLALENLDDVVLRYEDNHLDLRQLKHHLTRKADLTNSCKDFWKSIRIWSTHLKNGLIKLPDTILSLVSTSGASESSFISQLRPPQKNRDIDSIYRTMIEVAKNSGNKDLKDAFDAFLALSEEERKNLIEAIQVLDNNLSIFDIPGKIEGLLIGVRFEHREMVFERLEGWWINLITQHLNDKSSKFISREQVLLKIAAINDEYKPGSLPIEFFDAEPPNHPNSEIVNMRFVNQLKAITLDNRRIEKAILDYYRAYQQRSKWVTDNLIDISEISQYETTLVDEWERFCLDLQDRSDYDISTEDKQIEVGKKIYHWMEFDADSPIREHVSEPYILRGSYHILANKEVPRVWWHPKFIEQLQNLLATI